MSATVPSRLFAMFDGIQLCFGNELAAAAANRSSQPQHTASLFPRQRRASNIQPLEPTLLPKLRVCFADFPWLHSPHGPEAIHLGVLMRIRYGPGARKEIDLRRSFHEDRQGSVRYKNCIAFSMFSDAFHQLKCHSRRQQRQREKKTLHGPGCPSIRRC